MNRYRISIFMLAMWLSILNAPIARPQEPTTQPTTQAKKVDLTLDAIVEEGQKEIRATVKADGKPVGDVNVTFGIKRTFGVLTLGEDKTLDDGTAAVKFPTDIPGDGEGQLTAVAEIKPPSDYTADRMEALLGGAKPLIVDTSPLPRALWAPTAPFVLIVPIVLLLGGVWSIYAFVVSQIIAIRRGAKP